MSTLSDPAGGRPTNAVEAGREEWEPDWEELAAASTIPLDVTLPARTVPHGSLPSRASRLPGRVRPRSSTASRLAARLTPFGPSLVAMASQGLGLVQMFLLLRGGGAGTASDAYFLLYNWSLFPLQTLLLGVAYPNWIRRAGAGPGAVIRPTALAAAGCVVCLGATAIILQLTGTPSSQWMAAWWVLLAGVPGTAVAWGCALWWSAQGRAWFYSGVTLPSSIGACLALLIVPAGTNRPAVMAAGMGLATTIYAVWLVSVTRRAPQAGEGGSSQARKGDSGWYLLKSTTGYGANLAMQSATMALPASSLSILNVLIKVVGGFSNIATNALLPRFVNRHRADEAALSRYLWVVLGTTQVLCAGGLVVYWARASLPQAVSAWSVWVVLGAAWLLAATLNASLQRLAYRRLPARSALSSIVPCLVVPTALILGQGRWELTLPLVVGAFVVLELCSGAAFGVLLRARTLCLAVGGAVALDLALALALAAA